MTGSLHGRRWSFTRHFLYLRHGTWNRLVLSFLTVLALMLLAPAVSAQRQLVWRIGVDDDPLESGYDATHEFSQENFMNDPRPGKVTRLPGDPLYNATNNPT